MLHSGPWFCPNCRGIIAMYGPSDICYDFHLIDFLWTGHLPEDADEIDRIKELSKHYRAHGNKLQIKAWTPLGKSWVEVPPVPTRKRIAIDTHYTLGHCGRDKLVDSIRLDYWWPGMYHDIASVLAKCAVC